jgi:hypothetical protein
VVSAKAMGSGSGVDVQVEASSEKKLALRKSPRVPFALTPSVYNSRYMVLLHYRCVYNSRYMVLLHYRPWYYCTIAHGTTTTTTGDGTTTSTTSATTGACALYTPLVLALCNTPNNIEQTTRTHTNCS